MEQQYSIALLQQKFDAGEDIDLLCFWGHSHKQGGEVGKACLSQWYPAPFVVAGVTYHTAEHWMMAQKALLFGDRANYSAVINSETPKQAKALGREVLGFDDNLWLQHRYAIVVQGNIHKFNQHSALAKYLLATGDKVIVEASPVDAIWGAGLAEDSEHIHNIYAWRGLNLLGFALMEVRDLIRKHGHFLPLKDAMLTPRVAYPKKDYMDMFWRMGVGEEYIINYSKYWSSLSALEKQIYQLCYPAYADWAEWYD